MARLQLASKPCGCRRFQTCTGATAISKRILERRLPQSALSVAYALLITAWCAGCDSGSNAAGDLSAGAQRGGAAEGPEISHPLLLDGWDPPAAAIVLSGQQRGYVEPCGCSETQSGGLGRRHDLFRQIEQRGWPVTALDLGGTVQRNREQNKYKFDMILDALAVMGYEAAALGPSELRFGVDYLLSKREFDPSNTEDPLSFVGANITLFGAPDLGPRRWKLLKVGQATIGVTAVLGAGLRSTLIPQDARTELEIEDPNDALPPVIEELAAQQPDLMVLLAHADSDESRRLAVEFPEFDLVVSAGGPEDPDGKPERIGESVLVQVGRKGKYAGVVGLYPGNAETPLRFELVNLDSQRFQNTPKMHELMQYYQNRLRASVAAVMADLPASVHPRGATFVGAEKCGECHKKAHAKWQTTKHSHAYHSLIEGREGQKGNWIPRNDDPECLACHVTGWDPQEVLRYDSGFQLKALAGESAHLYEKLKGQQCENCHGPGSRHVEREETWARNREAIEHSEVVAARAEIKLTKKQAKQTLCHRCHDLDNSPNFNFEKYWEEVKHPWRD